MPTIGILASGVFALFSCVMILPAIAAALTGNARALEAILLIMVAYGFLASITIMALNSKRRRLNRSGVFVSAIVIWLALIAAATPIFMLVERQSLVHAIFEATSASITLGTTIRPLEEISIAMAFYRGTVAWLGGLATLMLAVYVIGPYQVGGTPNNNLRLVQHARTESHPRLFLTLKAVLLPYLGLTALCALLLALARVPASDAVVVAMSMLSTNGFVPYQSGGTVLNNVAAETVMIAFMVIGATSIVWHRMLVERRWSIAREQSEGMLFVTAVLVLVAFGALTSLFQPHVLHSNVQHAFNFAFDTIAIATTTGITHDQRLGIGLPLELILLISFVGGCSYSTAGGIKVFRLGTMLQHLGNELNRLVYPNAILKDDVQHTDQAREIAKAVWSAFFLAILTLTIGIILFAAQGYELGAAMTLANGAFAQVGSLVFAAAPGMSDGVVSDWTLMTIAALGTIARIEILVFLAAFAGKRW